MSGSSSGKEFSGVELAASRAPFVAPLDSVPARALRSGRMSTRSEASERLALQQGTLDLLILRTLLFHPEHGQGIARTIQQTSHEVILVEHGSLYPALQRLEAQRLVRAEWGVSENGRRARYYALTPRGRKHLAAATNRWRAMTAAIGRVLGPARAEG